MKVQTGPKRAAARRLGQPALAGRIAGEITGMMLAEAFVVARAAGCRLIVSKLDGVPHRPAWSGRGEAPVFVDIVLGIVRRSSTQPPT